MKKDRIVIKVGTSTLTNELGNSNLRTMEKLAMVLSDIQNMGHEVILVSSKTVAQIFLNAEDITQEEKKENLSNTFSALLESGVIPVVNENDSVSYTEIESEERLFSDNDVLSAVVAVLCQADKLVILSDIDGFFDKDPRLYKDAQLIRQIDTIDDSVYRLAGGAGSRRGTGGMRTKLQAADLATAQGIDTVVTNGKDPEILYKVVAGEPAGTIFKGKR